MMTKILFRATGLLIMLGTFAACEKNNEANKRYTSTMGASIDGSATVSVPESMAGVSGR